MKLKKLYISEYKNLNNFTIEFSNDSFVEMLIGKNGTGKSNLFEAIVEIFQHLIDETDIGFNYQIEYEINDGNVVIAFDGNLKLNNSPIRRISIDKLPETLLIYYSGHNDRIGQYIKKYETKYLGGNGRNLRNRNRDLRKIFGVKNSHKQLLLFLIMMLEDGNSVKRSLCEKLGIKSNIERCKLILKKPLFFNGKINIWDGSNSKYLSKDDEQNNKVNQNSFWGIDGNLRDFILKLNDGNKGNLKDGNEGFFGVEQNYYITLREEIVRNLITDFSIIEVFQFFEDLYLLDMVHELKYSIQKNNGDYITYSDFSDGEVQTIFFLSLMEIFKDKESILLLDEPDAFLHPDWQMKLIKNLELSAKEFNNHILITTHNASTVVAKNQKVRMLQYCDNNLRAISVNKSYGVQKLSSGLIALNEQEQTLNILNRIKIENKPVLFTEGVSDTIILKKAWDCLFGSPIPFNPVPAFSDEFLCRLLQDEKIYNESNGKPIFGLFDFDEAYNCWNRIKSNDPLVVDDLDKGLCTKYKDKDIYAFLLPVPQNENIRKQVVKNEQTKEHFYYESRLSIEHLFFGLELTSTHFEEISCRGDGIEIVFKGCKTNFAENIIPTLPKEAFEVFRPMFEFIQSTINS